LAAGLSGASWFRNSTLHVPFESAPLSTAQIKQDHALLTGQPAAQRILASPYDPTKRTAIYAFLTSCPMRKVELLEDAPRNRRQTVPSSRSPTDHRITTSAPFQMIHFPPSSERTSWHDFNVAMPFGRARSHDHHTRHKSSPPSSPPRDELDRLPIAPYDPTLSPWQ
jgi:hypothetical protein